jgi:hypothetical protein
MSMTSNVDPDEALPYHAGMARLDGDSSAERAHDRA